MARPDPAGRPPRPPAGVLSERGRLGLLLVVILTLVTLVYNFVLAPLVQGFLQEVLFNTVFLAVLAAVGYGMVQSARGRYPEIPVIAEASYLQIR
ncbi:MAG: hypothetical protein Q6K17_07120 [Gloeomargarita sp. GMQP_bins_5]